MRILDIGVCACYFALIAFIGHRAALKQRRNRPHSPGAAAKANGMRTVTPATADSGLEFHLAGRGAGPLVMGLSVMVTAFSSVNFVLFPSEVAGHGLYVAASLPVFLLVLWPVMHWALPFYARQKSASAYAWIEHRHGLANRRLASLLFIFWRLLWMALMLLAAARFLSQITGIGVPWLLLAAAAVATTYTAWGGMRAVLWTDAAQFAVLATAIVVSTAIIVRRAGGMGATLDSVLQSGGFAPFRPYDPKFLGLDPRYRISLGSALIGTSVAFMARYVGDQSIVQRYLSVKTLRTARRGFVWNILAALGSIGMLLILGLAVRANSQLTPGLASKPGALQLAQLLGTLPAGALGLVTAGLMAATMSSLDSGLHSCTTSLMVDWNLHSKARPRALAAPESLMQSQRGASPRQRRMSTETFGALSVATFGAISTLLAFLAQNLGDLFAVANRVVNGLGSPLLALLLAAMLPRGTTRRGIFAGTVVGALCSIYLTATVQPLAMHHYATLNFLATLACIAICSLADYAINK